MNVTSGLSPTRCSQLTEGPAFRERLSWDPWSRSQGPSSLVQAACVPSNALGSRKVGFKWQMCQEGNTSTPDHYLLWQQLELLCVPDKSSASETVAEWACGTQFYLPGSGDFADTTQVSEARLQVHPKYSHNWEKRIWIHWVPNVAAQLPSLPFYAILQVEGEKQVHARRNYLGPHSLTYLVFGGELRNWES